ncbi:MAG: rhodanese-like domain-containing protein [Candidatus Chryseobacterium colombiense]|nr:rhodanese-like domain-containing protein [Chryseobacterium sp.]WEK69679.1 MAG: rhodanese-like domain-containing protein [Chryseobacterium sp.]
MKRIMFLLAMLMCFGGFLKAQTQPVPWTPNQVMAPDILAAKIVKKQTKNILILSVGPSAVVKGSVDMGMANDPQNLEKLQDYVRKLDKNKEIVIYCGCCPYDRCPNIRPAFNALVEMGFKNVKILDLPKNVKTNWIDHDYPTND